MSKNNFLKQKHLYLLATLFIAFSSFIVRSDISHAQQPTSNSKISSDLRLDLNLAQQNPDPDQQQIIQDESKQAEMVLDTGDVTTITPSDTVTKDVEIESNEEAVHPEETTSEQVVTEPEEIEADENDTPVPTEIEHIPSVTEDQPTNKPTEAQSENPPTGEPTKTENFIPGTNIIQPNDNAAPTDNSTNPNLPAPTDIQQSTTQEPQISQPINDTNSNDSSVEGAATGPNPLVVFLQKFSRIFSH